MPETCTPKPAMAPSVLVLGQRTTSNHEHGRGQQPGKHFKIEAAAVLPASEGETLIVHVTRGMTEGERMKLSNTSRAGPEPEGVISFMLHTTGIELVQQFR